jgi:NADH-quinone oxidoreductase subunit M
MASVGLPGTSGFVGEFLTIIGAFKANKAIGIFAALGVIFGACYMLWLYKRVWFSEIHNKKIESFKDVNLVEFGSLALMAGLVILLGVLPNLAFSFYDIPTNQIVNIFSK